MIVQVDVQLAAQQEVRAQEKSYTGYLVRGLVYAALRSVDPKYAERLHSEKGQPAPFSVRPPHALVRGRVRIFDEVVPANTPFSVQVTSLDEQLAGLLCKALMRQGESVELGRSKVRVLSLAVRQVSPEDLRGREAVEKFAVRFLTPTFFRAHVPRSIRRDRVELVRVLPLPDPLHLFTNLYNTWNAYLRPEIEEDYLEWLQQRPILISRLKGVETRRYYEHPVKGVFAIGFTGTAYYALAEDTYDERMARITSQLLKLAELSGVGGNRTAGFGWVEVRYPKKASAMIDAASSNPEVPKRPGLECAKA